jgi:type I restriction enzyme S subunit
MTSLGWSELAKEGWGLLPVRSAFSPQYEKHGSANGEYLSLMASTGVIPYAEKGDIGNKAPEDMSKCKRVSKGDFVINSMNFGIGSFGVSSYDGICSPVYLVLKPNDQLFNTSFVSYIFQMKQFQQHAQSFGNGILAHRAAVGWDELKNIALPVPPLDEQKAIADFLDHESLQMNELQSLLLKLTESLNERRLSFITAEFERLISTSCQEIPLKRCLEFPLKYGANESGETELIDGVRYLRISDFGKKGVLRTENPQYLERQIAKNYLVKTGDLLLARSGATVGKAYLVPSEGSGSCFAGYLIQARPQREKLIPEYLSYFLESYQFESWRQTNFTQSTIQNISAQKYGEMRIPCPTINDQTCLVEKLVEELRTIDSAMELLSNAVVSIQERLQSLISSAVTGKIDVRKAA